MSSYIQHTHAPSSIAGLTEPENRKDLGDTGRVEIVHAATSGNSLHTDDHMLEQWADAHERVAFDFFQFDFRWAANDRPFSLFGEREEEGDEEALRPAA
ncbi:MAG: hypothetical protein H6861_03155 [Rhodospirillales bacterium]|nr:hypothetical protein [Rhodospirillales bacterium]